MVIRWININLIMYVSITVLKIPSTFSYVSPYICVYNIIWLNSLSLSLSLSLNSCIEREKERGRYGYG